MSTERVPYGTKFTCDCCGDEWEPPRPRMGFPPRDFADCLDLAKEDGWRAVHVTGLSGTEDRWEHRCPDCA